MLAHLAVTNLGVIEQAAIDPSPRLTVITGETGTGKTLLLGSIRQLLGDQAKSGLVGPTDDHAVIDGLFINGTEEIGVTRTIPNDGRSRAHVDGAIVSAAKLRETTGPLVEVVGQHDQLSIRRPGQLRSMVDSALDPAGRTALADFHMAWSNYQKSLKRQAELGGDLTGITRELGLARHQAAEIEAAGLSVDLDTELENLVSRLRNVEEIKETLGKVVDLNEAISDQMGEVVAHLRKAGEYDVALIDLRDNAESLVAQSGELSWATRVALEGQETDPGRLTEVESSLTELGDLKRKYGKTIEDVLAFGIEIKARADDLEKLLSESEDIEERVGQTHALVMKSASHLTKQRSTACARLTASLISHLADLGLAGATAELVVTPSAINGSGADEIQFLFASDDRLEPRPVGDVASGGELSRLVLAFRLAVSSEETTTLVFDEIDSGLGGQTALTMGKKLRDLALTTQVLCVTHLPHIAAQGDRHYVVDRAEDGVASVRMVDGPDRVEAIAMMMAGAGSSAGGQAAATELLTAASKR